MNTTQKLGTLPWKLIIALGLFALVRPLIKIFGVVWNYEVPAVVVLAITAVIALGWIGAVVKLRVSKPVVVLALSGAVYGVVSILMAVVIQLCVPDLRDSEAKIPVLLTVGLVATTVFNVIYSAILGFIAQGVQKVISKRRD